MASFNFDVFSLAVRIGSSWAAYDLAVSERTATKDLVTLENRVIKDKEMRVLANEATELSELGLGDQEKFFNLLNAL